MLIHAIAFFLTLLPFQFATGPFFSIDVPIARIFAVGIVCFWFGRALSTRKFFLPPILVTGGIISLLFLVTSALLWVNNSGAALRKILFLWNFLPLIFVFYDLGREKAVLEYWVRALLLGGIGIALLSLGMFFAQFIFGLEPVIWWLRSILPYFLGQNLSQTTIEYSSLLVNLNGETWLRVSGLFPDPHVASFYFGMISLLAGGLFVKTKNFFWLVIGGILIVSDLLTFSRGGYFGIIVGVGAFFLSTWRYLTSTMKKWIYLTIFLGIMVTGFFGQPIISRFFSSFSLVDGSNSERISLWNEALGYIYERPLLGTGIGNYMSVARPLFDSRAPFYAHNLYLDLMVELGLFGLFFFLLPLANAIFYGLHTENKRINYQEALLSIGALSSLWLYCAHSFFETAIYSVHILPILLLVITVALYQKSPLKISKIEEY